MLYDAITVMRRYEGWYEGCSEDSWRLQRDMMTALHIEPEADDTWEQGDNGEFIRDPDVPPEEFMPADMDDEKDMRL